MAQREPKHYWPWVRFNLKRQGYTLPPKHRSRNIAKANAMVYNDRRNKDD